uniref:uncharacterized protein LOC131106649 n=1 Tax=Doryrhamphus excisus TaxID=161450 RepID=UPI0025ADC862|nr:uncharacterized protein LOC131106649 [Doryrhamphus excisus]
MVARLTPDQKVACSSHVRVTKVFYARGVPNLWHNLTTLGSQKCPGPDTGPCGAMVARLAPDQKVACSSHVGVTKVFYARDVPNLWHNLTTLGSQKCPVPNRTLWRNGSASDSRSEGCVFESRQGHKSVLCPGCPKPVAQSHDVGVTKVPWARHRTLWRNGSASDSRSEGCVFKSRRGHKSVLCPGCPKPVAQSHDVGVTKVPWARHRTLWRNGSASDSRSEGCVFESRRGHKSILCPGCCKPVAQSHNVGVTKVPRAQQDPVAQW